MKFILKNLKSFYFLTFYEKLLFLFPIVLILRPVVVNIFLILVSLIFVYEFLKKKYYFIFSEKWILFFLLFIFYSIVRGFFSMDPMTAVISGISLIKFLFFSLFIYLCIPSIKNLNVIIKFWIIILILLCIDTLIQYYFSKDLFGFTNIGNRLTGPFGRHQIVGAYLSYITVPLIFYFFSNFKNFNNNKKFFLYFFYLLLFITIALTGERLAFIIFLSSSIVIFFLNFRLKYFFYLFAIIIILLLSIYYLSASFNNRVYEFYFTIINIPVSPWGRLYQSAYLVFKTNIFFGVGLKNYPFVCDNQIIDPLKNITGIPQFCSTHPHHLYLEILSESGIVGLILLFTTFSNFFYLIFKRYKKLKTNKIVLEYKGLLYGNILILFIYFWPIKTSGRFFTTWNGSFFWFNLGLALLITKDVFRKKYQ
jgi:O-antigen ligase